MSFSQCIRVHKAYPFAHTQDAVNRFLILNYILCLNYYVALFPESTLVSSSGKAERAWERGYL